MIGKIKGGKLGSIKNFKKEVKKGAGGSETWFYRIKPDTEVTVRFMAEPDEWAAYWQHYIDGKGAFPCHSGDCVGCEEGNKARKVWVAPALVIESGEAPRPRAMQLPATIVDIMSKRYDRYNTVMDRDYVIAREGSTQTDTTYDVEGQAPRKRADLRKYEVPDIEAILEQQLAELSGEADDDEDDFPAPKRPMKRVAKSSRKVPGQRKPVKRMSPPASKLKSKRLR